MTLVVITLFSITAVESLEDILGLTIGHTAFGIGARFPIVVWSSTEPTFWLFPDRFGADISFKPNGGKSAAKSKSVAKDADSDSDSPRKWFFR